MMHTLEVVKGARRLDDLVARAERTHSAVREDKRIKTGIYAVACVPLYEKNGFAGAYQVDEKLIGEIPRRKHFIIPCHAVNVVTLHPYAGVARSGADKLHIHGVIDKRAVGAQFLNGIP